MNRRELLKSSFASAAVIGAGIPPQALGSPAPEMVQGKGVDVFIGDRSFRFHPHAIKSITAHPGMLDMELKIRPQLIPALFGMVVDFKRVTVAIVDVAGEETPIVYPHSILSTASTSVGDVTRVTFLGEQIVCPGGEIVVARDDLPAHWIAGEVLRLDARDEWASIKPLFGKDTGRLTYFGNAGWRHDFHLLTGSLHHPWYRRAGLDRGLIT